MKTTIINLYGGPGVGKSTSAAYLYYLLKSQGKNVELVREYVKDWAWEGRKINAYDEIYFLGKQVRHESMLFGKVEYVVTDAPVFMTSYYATLYCSAGLSTGIEQAALAFYQQAREDGHQHLHIFLKREKPYQADGRYQTEEQALSVDRGVRQMLLKFNIPMIDSAPNETSLLHTLETIQQGGYFYYGK